MARRKEIRYRFDASAGIVKIPDVVLQNSILLIVNVTDGIVIASQLDPGKGFTIVNFTQPVTDSDFLYAVDGYTEVTLEYDTSAMSDTDSLAIYIDDEVQGLKVKPYDFAVDAIERIRVADPQSLIDADFEYGLQLSKWQNLGLNRNIPSFYETPGTGLVTTEISSGAQSPNSTITVTVDSGAPAAGTPITVFGTEDPLAEGIFIVLTSNDTTSFTYQAKGVVPSGSIFTPYSIVKTGSPFAQANLPVNSMSSDGTTDNSRVTVNFTYPHGLVPGSPITVVDTASNTSFEGNFFANEIPDQDTIIYDAGQTVTVGTISTTNVLVYARNDSFFTHRPFDGGVLMGPFVTTHGLEAKRQTKRYFRYQSGKGILFSTGTLFNPVFDIQSATYSSPDITVTTQIRHGLQRGATVRLYGIDSENYDGDYRVKSIIDEDTFTVEATVAPTDATAKLSAQPRIVIIKWSGASIRCGLFDDTNGMYWEYDGKDLYVVKRSSTFQLAGSVSVTNESNIVNGTNTRFTEQLKVGDSIIIRGQRCEVIGIVNDTQIYVNPRYRGVSATKLKPTIVREIRVRQDQFNNDRINGIDSPSGFTLNLAKMQMLGIQYSWYGAGFIDYMIRGALGEFTTVHRIPNNNVNDEAYMRSGNLPARYEVVNKSAVGILSTRTGLTTTSLTLKDASTFPDTTASFPEYVLITSNQSGTIYGEILSYTGKTGNTLTGVTTATSYSQVLSGIAKTFTGTRNSYDHPEDSGVILLNTNCAPTISHWGSAVVMDGGFDVDTGFQFNLATFNTTINGNATAAVLYFRPAPSVSNTISGALGEREIINRSVIQLQSLQINNVSNRNIEIAGVLNPSNLSGITWTSANATTFGANLSVSQPSFAQFNTNFDTLPSGGEILFRYLSTSGNSSFDLTGIKEIQNSVIGGNGTFPDGPEVIVFVIANRNNQSAVVDLSLSWQEAQA